MTMTGEPERRPINPGARWSRRFADAFDGLVVGFKTQESLHVHLFFTLLVVSGAAFLGFDLVRWCLLLLCVSSVIALELMNSAIERLVKTLHPEHDQGLAETLHLAASAVLVGALGATAVGLLLFVPLVWRLLSQYID